MRNKKDDEDEYEVVKIVGDGGKNNHKILKCFSCVEMVIRQRKLLLRDAIVILLAVSLSSLSGLIYPMIFGPIESKIFCHQLFLAPMILILFYLMTVLSCYFLYELSVLT